MLFNMLCAILFLAIVAPCSVFAETALFIQKDERINQDNDLDGFYDRLTETAGQENLKILDCEDEDSAVRLCREQGISYLAVVSVKRTDTVRTDEYGKYLTRTIVEKSYTPSVALIDIKTGEKSVIFQDNGVAPASIKELPDLIIYSLLYKTQKTSGVGDDSNKKFRVKKFGILASAVWVKPQGAYADIIDSAFGGGFRFSAYPFKENNIMAAVQVNAARCLPNAVSISSARFASAFFDAGYTFFREEVVSFTPLAGAGYVFNIINGKATYAFSDSGRFSYNPALSASIEFSLNIFSGSSFIVMPSYTVFFGQKELCRYFALSGGVTARF